MSSKKAPELIEDYAGNTWLIGKLSEGLTHKESLAQPPFEANCFNWVLGHILSRRHTALQVMDAGAYWPEEVLAVYRSGSPPIEEPGHERRLEDLLADLAATQEKLAEALGNASPEFMETEVETDRGVKARAAHLSGLHWHETYHLGQLEPLRALALSKRAVL